MRAIFFILILSGLLVSCNASLETNQQEIDSKNSIHKIYSTQYLANHNEPDFEEINIDQLKNYSTVLKEMQLLSCEDKSIGLKFHLNDTILHVTGYTECPTSGIISCYFNRNSLHIKNDSLKNFSNDPNRTYSINRLGEQLKTMSHIDHHDLLGNVVLKQILIHLYIDDRYPISKTKEVLAKIERQIEKGNSEMGDGYYRYILLFEEMSILDLPPSMPPPPPPPIDGK